MSNNPNSSDPSKKPLYKKIKQLESNTQTSRTSYLAKNNASQQLAVIKEFALAEQSDTWVGFKAYQNQIQALYDLNHPGIPVYLKVCPTKSGLAIIREYKEATSLAEPRDFQPKEIKKIAISLLEILVYLQEQETPIIHRNIKPENILIDEELNVFIIDFGWPVIDAKGASKNSKAGSQGFMPREQSSNKELTKSTDIYGLAVSLLCALSKTPSTQTKSLTGVDGRFNILGVIPNNISTAFVEWLEKMLQPYPKTRYPDAATALEALNQVDVLRSPEPVFDQDFLEFKATEYGEKITQIVRVTNDIPDTVLQGNWQIAPHPQERKNSKGLPNWISFNPRTIKKNKVECKITIDTSKLMANEIYEREFFLKTKSSSTNPSLTISVETPPLLSQQFPRIPLILLLLAAVAGGYFCGFICDGRFLNIISAELGYRGLLLGLAVGALSGLTAAFSLIPMLGSSVILLKILYFGSRLFYYGRAELVIAYFVGGAIWTFAGWIMRHHCSKAVSGGQNSSLFRAISSPVGIISSLLTMFNLSCGIALNGLPALRMVFIIILLATGIPLAIVLSIRYSQQITKLSQYRKSLPRLTRP